MDLPFEINNTAMDPGLIHTQPSVAIPYAIILGVFAIVGTFGNILIIGSMTSGSNRKVVGNYFIVNLAVCDIVVTLIINPMAIVGIVKGLQLYDGYYWSCKLLGSVCVVVCICSLLNIGAISINRYTFIVHNTRYNKIYTSRSTLTMCLLTWVLAYLVDLPAHVHWSDHGFDLKTDKCLWDRTKNWYYTVFAISVGIVLPLLVIICFYTLIFQHIKAAKKRLAGSSKGDRSAFQSAMRQAKMMFVIFVCFSSCWLPYSLLLLLDRHDTYPVWAHLYGSMIAHLHASINFIIYGVSNHKIRDGYIRFLYRNFICCVARHEDGSNVVKPSFTQSIGRQDPEGGNPVIPVCCFKVSKKVFPDDDTVYTIDGTTHKGQR